MNLLNKNALTHNHETEIEQIEHTILNVEALEYSSKNSQTIGNAFKTLETLIIAHNNIASLHKLSIKYGQDKRHLELYENDAIALESQIYLLNSEIHDFMQVAS